MLDLQEALSQVNQFINNKTINAVVSEDETQNPLFQEFSMNAETICIHSDSPIALELAKHLHRSLHDHY